VANIESNLASLSYKGLTSVSRLAWILGPIRPTTTRSEKANPLADFQAKTSHDHDQHCTHAYQTLELGVGGLCAYLTQLAIMGAMDISPKGIT